MGKEVKSISGLFRGVPLSHPLKGFKSNLEGINYVARSSTKMIERHKETTKKLYKESIESKEKNKKLVEEFRESLEKARRFKKDMRDLKGLAGEGKEHFEELEEWGTGQVKILERLLRQGKRIGSSGDKLIEGWLESIDKYEKANEMILPMVFVFLVTVWDAFILDTVRRLLRVNPEMITESNEEVRVNVQFLLSVESNEDIRNYIMDIKDYIIEDKVRRLDHNRRELIRCFRDEWGINWEKSGIELNDIVEIRARRDIWVHNQGMVNRQYINMVGERNLIGLEKKAQIDIEYFDNCLKKLTELAVYIHRIAHEKYYAKADVG
jgi:hypothetical protein